MFDPPYNYFLHDGADVKNVVLDYAGVDTLGDYDGNGVRNGLDFLVWQRGESPTPSSQLDLNDWEAYFGDVSPLTGLTTVPEPGAMILVFGGSCLGLLLRWRNTSTELNERLQ